MIGILEALSRLIAAAIEQAYPEAKEQLGQEDIYHMLEVPPNRSMGDYAFPCFRLARTLRAAPPDIAARLCARMDGAGFCTADSAGGYLNLFLDKPAFAREVLDVISKQSDLFGGGSEGEGKTICLDYSSINIAKRFHIGHLSTTLIGHSLKRIYDFLGYHTVGINHLGDWGTQFGNLLCAIRRWGGGASVDTLDVQTLMDLYVKFHEEAEMDPSLPDEGRAWFKRIEDGDPEAAETFERIKALTLKDTQKVYELLNITFDSYAGESFYQDKMTRVLEELKAKNLLIASEGASIVDLEPYGMPPCLILKKDGTTLYATRDIAAALYRYETYHFAKCLYIVAYQQDLHFRQWFKVLELMGYPFASDLVHVAFGMVSFEGETLSTRKGKTVYLEDLLNMALEKALAVINEKSPDLPNKDEAARQVGIGAVIYQTLSSNRIKDIDFYFDRALNFEGETGPYVQYTHARCCAVLRKAAEQALPEPDWEALSDEEAQALLHLLSRFPLLVREAAVKYEPFVITRGITDICQAYNRFYRERRILDDDLHAASARVKLTQAVKDVVKRGLWLIGMEAPERM